MSFNNATKQRLGDIIDIKHGFAFKGEFFSLTKTDDLILSPGNFKIGGGFKVDKFKYYNGKYPKEYILKENDIIVTMTDLSKEGDTLGYSAKIPFSENKRYLHNQRLGLVEFKNNDFDEDYIYWLLRTKDYQSFIVNSATGTTVRHTAPTRIKEYEFLAPNKTTQTKIANILSSIDDKIELNSQINQTLETVAQTLFKDWFFKFNYPNASTETMETKLGFIPNDWEIKSILEVAEVTDFVANGSFASLAENVTYKSEEDYSILIRLTDYNRGFNGDFVYVDEKAYKFLSKSALYGNEIIIANVGANAGDVFRTPKLDKPMTLGPNAIMIKPSILSHYLYLYFISKNGQQTIKNIISGSAQPKFNKTDFRKLKVVIPKSEVIDKFNIIYQSIDDKITTNIQETQNLIALRDSLLPKLMKGEIAI